MKFMKQFSKHDHCIIVTNILKYISHTLFTQSSFFRSYTCKSLLRPVRPSVRNKTPRTTRGLGNIMWSGTLAGRGWICWMTVRFILAGCLVCGSHFPFFHVHPSASSTFLPAPPCSALTPFSLLWCLAFSAPVFFPSGFLYLICRSVCLSISQSVHQQPLCQESCLTPEILPLSLQSLVSM